MMCCLALLGVATVFAQSKGPCGLGEVIGKGAEITIVGVHSEDAYFDNKSDYIGKKGVTMGNLNTYNDACYYTGAVQVEGMDDEAFFLAVKFTVEKDGIVVEDAADEVAVVEEDEIDESDQLQSGEIGVGTRVKILGIGKGDSYRDDRASIIGKEGVVKEVCSKDDDEEFYAGGITTDDGEYYYFAEVDLIILEGEVDEPVGENVVRDASKDIPLGTKIKIVGLEDGDAYYSDRKDIIGLTGFTMGVCEYDKEDGSFAGSIKADNGRSFYFANVRLEIVK